MSQSVETNTKTLNAASAVGQFLRVKVNSSGLFALAGATDSAVGVNILEVFAANDRLTAKLRTGAGTVKMVASGAITRGNVVYAAASGKIAASGSIVEGVALETSTTDGDIIEVMLFEAALTVVSGFGVSTGTVAATGSTQGDAAALTGYVGYDVTAGDDTKGVVLPTAVAGLVVLVYNSGSAGLKIYPATADTINGGSANAAITILEETMAILWAKDATDWGAIFTANS